MKRIFMITLAIMCAGMILFAFAACSDEAEKEATGEETKEAEKITIVGKWESKDMGDVFYNFNEDGTGSYSFFGSEMKFTYEDDGEAVTIQYENTTEPNVFKYNIEGKTLNIEDSFGEIVEYVKK